MKSKQSAPAKPPDLILDRGLPANVEAEQFVLGSVLLFDQCFADVTATLKSNDFCISKHRHIFDAMAELANRGEKIEYLTLANELIRAGQLEACDGAAYLSQLTEGTPRLDNISSYVGIVKDKALLREAIMTAQVLIGNACNGSTAREVLADARERFLALDDGVPNDGAVRIRTAMEQFGSLENFLNPAKRPKGLQTGFTRLDEMTGGFRPQELIVVAARPSVGKSSFALNLAEHAAVKCNDAVAFFSLEMSKVSLADRLVCSIGRVDSHRFRGGWLNSEERQRLAYAANQLAVAPLFIDDASTQTVAGIYSKCRRIRGDRGLALVIVDYLQLMESKGKENRTQEVSAISRGLKRLAKDLDVPVVSLAQLSRKSEDRKGDHKPILSDLRESGEIEQTADVVLFLYRPSMYFPDRQDMEGVTEVIIGKNRNGPTATVNLVWIDKFMKFENRAEV